LKTEGDDIGREYNSVFLKLSSSIGLLDLSSDLSLLLTPLLCNSIFIPVYKRQKEDYNKQNYYNSKIHKSDFYFNSNNNANNNSNNYYNNNILIIITIITIEIIGQILILFYKVLIILIIIVQKKKYNYVSGYVELNKRRKDR
jgi:hypothetical protein